MKFSRKKEISFSTFYLIEFFNITLSRLNSKIADSHYKILKDLAEYLIKGEPIVESLEKIARHQVTNDVAIFLFDMIERANDYGPGIVYNALPELAEDFQNLYTLLIEEEESVKKLQEILDEFAFQYGELEKQKEIEEFAGSPEKTDSADEIGFNTFYAREFENRLRTNNPDQVESIMELVSIIGANPADNYSTLPSEMQELVSTIRHKTALVSTKDNQSLIDLYEDMDATIYSVSSNMQELTNIHPELIKNIRSEKSLVVDQAVEQNVQQQAVSTEKDPNVNSLLVEYFQSEVNDFVERVNKLINDLLKKEQEDQASTLIAEFKSLKEISMIHGYSGMEHIAHLMLTKFKNISSQNKKITSDTYQIIQSIFESFKNVEKFYNRESDPDLMNELKNKIENINSTFADIEAEQISSESEATPDKVEKTAETDIEPEFGIDSSDFLKLSEELINYELSKIVAADHTDYNQSLILFDKLLTILKENKFYWSEDINAKLIPALNAYYFHLKKETPNQAESEKFFKIIENLTNREHADYQTAAVEIQELIKTGEDEYQSSSDQVIKALVDSSLKLWSRIKDDFTQNFSEHKKRVIDFLDNFFNNLKILGLSNYDDVVKFIKDKIESETITSEQASECADTISLLIERLNYQGKNSDTSDILSALEDVFDDETSEASKTEAAEENKELSVEEEIETTEDKNDEIEDIRLFKDETEQNFNLIQSKVEQFNGNPDREILPEIENASHSIRSAAHLLNFQNIAQLAAGIEEICELFGQSELELPTELGETLVETSAALSATMENPDNENSELLKKLDAFLDQVVIEDSGKTDESELENFVTQSQEEDDTEQTKTIEEKPLFSAEEDEDEELFTIFREESANFLSTLKDANSKLHDAPTNTQIAREMGNAAHSLKSAAKMLGFQEISQIADHIEILTDSVSEEKIQFTNELHEKLNATLDILDKLSLGESISESQLSVLLNDLELEKWSPEESRDDLPDEEYMPENVVSIFVEEAREILNELSTDFLELEKMPESEMILANILRRTHTLKGSAYISKFNRTGDLAHKLEDFFQIYKQKSISEKEVMFDAAFSSLDLLNELVDCISTEKNEEIDHYTSRLAEIDNKMFSHQNYDTSLQESTQPKTILKEGKLKTSSKKRGDDENSIRINSEYMDKLLDMASELMINQTQLGSHLHDLKEVLSEIEGERKQIRGVENVIEETLETASVPAHTSEGKSKKEEINKISDNIRDVVRTVNTIYSDLNRLTQGFEQNLSKVSSLSKLLHNDMLKTRMVPVDSLFNRYPRAVRDMAKSQSKKVNLIIEDNNTEMDRAMVEGLSEPILHIIRNAVDHGLEKPAERKNSGKAETGTLLLKARQDKNQIVIDIEDDGCGIDIDRVKEKIIHNNIADEDTVQKMSEAEVLDYIFYPGFTTRDDISDVSGRGIGLDAVANQIQKLKGNIRVKTEKNIGTSFSLRVPLTLLISQGLMVNVSNQMIVIPVIAVQESVQFNEADLVKEGEKSYLRVRGRLLPFIKLNQLLKFPEDSGGDNAEKLAVVIYDAGVSIALGVDEIIGRQEIVIKSLGSHLQNVDYVAGGTILANGSVALILDYALIIRTIEMQYFGRSTEGFISRRTIKPVKKRYIKAQPKKEKKPEKIQQQEKEIVKKDISDRKPQILIVDDSNSVRNFVGSILERNGFTTIKSTNGLDALEKMKNETVDLIITDLEMPKMHGFDLISNIRKQDKFLELPIIILTGRAGMKHRQAGEELGANAFIVKPFKEKDLLESLAKFINK